MCFAAHTRTSPARRHGPRNANLGRDGAPCAGLQASGLQTKLARSRSETVKDVPIGADRPPQNHSAAGCPFSGFQGVPGIHGIAGDSCIRKYYSAYASDIAAQVPPSAAVVEGDKQRQVPAWITSGLLRVYQDTTCASVLIRVGYCYFSRQPAQPCWLPPSCQCSG